MNRRRPTREDPEQLPLPSPPTPKPRRRSLVPEDAAKNYIRRRAKPSVVPGHVKLTFTLDLPREVAERLSARAIREGINLDAVLADILGKSGEQ